MNKYDDGTYYEEIGKIILGISRRLSYKFKDIDVDELSQELWLEVLTKEQDKGHKLDGKLVAKICYDRVVDLQRFFMIRNHYNCEDFSPYEDSQYSQENIDRSIIIRQLHDKFPKGSRESIFLEYYMTSEGIEDFGYRPQGRNNGGYTEKNLSKLLGFSSSNDRRFKNFRSYMRDLVKKFLEN